MSAKPGQGDEAVDADVAVVGFGPVGATMAGLLAQRGISVIVFDREVGIYPLPRAAHIDHTGLRTLQELGCLDQLLPTMIPNTGTQVVTDDCEVIVRIPSQRRTVTGLPPSMYFYQPVFDGILRSTATSVEGVTVRLATTVVGLEPDAQGVTICTEDSDGQSHRWRTRWLVGCDGASSFVRAALDIPTAHSSFHEQWLIFDLLLGRSDLGLPDHAVQVRSSFRPRTELPMPDNRFRYEFMLLDGEDPDRLSRPEVAFAELLPEPLSPDVAVIERTATYTFEGVVGATWRSGRAFIAGDAAHVMPPFLGQGMCSGLRDAANLAWKLSAVVRDGADQAILDTYTEERKPHVSHVIAKAIEVGEIICGAARPDAVAESVSDVAARLGSYSFSLPPLTPGALVGDRGGDYFGQPWVDGVGLDDVVGQRFLVLSRDAADQSASAALWRQIGALVASPADLGEMRGPLETWLDEHDVDVVIVRPDRYVLDAGRSLHVISGRYLALLARKLAA